MKTRILFVTNALDSGGAEKHLIELIQRLASSSVDCTILYYGLDWYTRHLGDRPYIRILAPNRGATDTFLSYWRTFARLRPHVVVFVNGLHGTFGWYAYAAAKLSGARRLFAIEHLIADPAPPELQGSGLWNSMRRVCGWRARYIWRLRLPALLCHRTICVSNAVRERLVGEYGYPESRIMTILNGVDLEYFNPRSVCSPRASASSAAVIVCVARLTQQKRLDLLLRAMSLVTRTHPACKCLLVGGGPREVELRSLSVELGLAKTVTFVGHVEDVRPYLEAADLFVLSSDKEGLPLVLAEAMAYSVPCVATDVGGNREIIAHGHTGVLVEPGSPEHLAQAIDYLLAHPEERTRMGSRAKERVHEHFNLDGTMEKLTRVLVGES